MELIRLDWAVIAGYFAAYRPVENKRDVGSAWNQQVRYFRKEHLLNDINPREQMIDVLLAEVAGWVTANETVIVGMEYP
jgi:hypothetical protein